MAAFFMPDVLKTTVSGQDFEMQSSKLVEEAKKDALAFRSKRYVLQVSTLFIKPVILGRSDDEGQKGYLLN